MHIRAFVGAAVAALCMLAIAPAAYAVDPAPDICVLDLSHPIAVDHAVDLAGATCVALAATEVASVVPISPDGEDEPIAACTLTSPTSFDFASYRLHIDPGRCSA